MYLCNMLPIFGYIIVRLNNGSPITYCCFSENKTGKLSNWARYCSIIIKLMAKLP